MGELLGLLLFLGIVVLLGAIADDVITHVSYDAVVHRIKMKACPYYRAYHEMTPEEQALMRVIAAHLQKVNPDHW